MEEGERTVANWLMVTSEESFNATLTKGVLGFYGDSKGAATIRRTAVGDQIIFYVTKKRVVRGLFTVESTPFLDESPLYGDHRDQEWNQRIRIKALDSTAEYDFTMLRWDLDFIVDKGISYSAYLVNTLIPLSDKDFSTIIDALGISNDRLVAAQEAPSK